MMESPRTRRLKSDFEAMTKLVAESSIITFGAEHNPPDVYRVRFRGKGAYRNPQNYDVLVSENHEVVIRLTAAYPRMIPELIWQTPIFHPNISGSGVVCLGGYQTNWVPSLRLDELCIMLWDMIRFANYDVNSPYNREAAIWAKGVPGLFPLDRRPLRDLTCGEHQLATQNAGQTTVTVLDDDGIEIVDAEVVPDSKTANESSADVFFIS